jgi:outer membrane biogenesis lipoprotein LolB
MRRLFLLTLLAGCPVAPLPPVQRPYAPPAADELLRSVTARRDKLQSLHAEGKADEGRAKVTIELLVAQGGRMRLEMESPLGGAVAVLTTDGNDFQLLDQRNNRFLVGPAQPCNVARLIGVSLSPDQVMSVVAGSAPVEGEPAGVAWDETHGGREVLELKTPDGGSEKLWLDGRNRTWDVRAAERKDAAGHTLWKVSHDDFADQGGFRLPGKTSIEEPARHAQVRVRWRQQDPNVTVKDGIFRLNPHGLPPQPVGCQ